jgi:hypothetical protein
MKCGARVAIGVAGGYFLGRTKKMKLALMLGGLAAGRRAGGPGELLGQGMKLVGSSPELAALRDQLTGRLVDAGKEAVMAVAARQIGSLTDRVSERVESLADPERLSARPRRKARGTVDEEAEEAPDTATDEEGPDDAPNPDADDEADTADEGAERTPAKSTTRSRSTSANSQRSRTSTRNGRTSDSDKATSADRATPKRRSAGSSASRSAGAARSGTKAATTRAARGTRSAR